MSISKGVTKWSSKQKSEGKDDCPLKKGPAFLTGDKPKKSLPPKTSHGAGKGLMMAIGPVTQETICRLLTNKEHVVEMDESIIKDTDLDPCAEQTTKELEASSLFYLSRVRPFFKLSFIVVYSLADGCLVFRRWCV